MTASIHSAQAVGAEIKRRLELCTVAQGAESDLGTNIYLGRRRVDADMIPCATLIEADDTPGRTKTGTTYEMAQRYVAFAYVPCDPLHPNLAAHAAIRDMKRALFRTEGKPDFKMGGNVRLLEYVGRDIGPREDGSAFVVAAIEVVATYVEDLANP